MDSLKCWRITAEIDFYIREFVDQDEVRCIGTKRNDASILVVATFEALAKSFAMDYFSSRKPEKLRVELLDEPVAVVNVMR